MNPLSLHRTASRSSMSFKRRNSATRGRQGNDLVLYILAVLLPFIPVAIKTRSAADTIINVCLLCLGYFPAIIHAFYILLRKPPQPRQVVIVQQVPSSAPASYPPTPLVTPQPQLQPQPFQPEPVAKQPLPPVEKEDPFEDQAVPEYIDYRGRQAQAYEEAQEAAGKWKAV
ncbi:hypothetical protein JCM6882_006229 [Rhodosporidiobolus microsporus]